MKLRGRKLTALTGAVLLLLGLSAGLAGCSKRDALPDFPVYAPTAPFLEEQKERKRRALAIAEYQRREKLKYGIKSYEETLAAWLPIYNRAELAREFKPLRDKERQEAIARFQEQTKARWLPLQRRIYITRISKPQRKVMDRELMRQYQEKTKGEWLPHQNRIFEHRESREQREFEAFVKKRKEAKYPRGTRLPNGGGKPRLAP